MFDLTSSAADNPYLCAVSLDSLLNWTDVDFVRCAYVTILGRQPDAPGEAFYLRRLRSGISKHAILRQLRRSREAAYHNPGIAGLDRALRKVAWEEGRWGTLVRLVTRGEGDGPAWRRHRSLLNAIERAELDRRRHAEQSLNTINTKLDLLNESLKTAAHKAAPLLREAAVPDRPASQPEFDDDLPSSARNVARTVRAALSRA